MSKNSSRNSRSSVSGDSTKITRGAEDASPNDIEESNHNSTAVSQSPVVDDYENEISARLSNLMNKTSDQCDYQKHITTIFEHTMEIDGMELSEIKEKTRITKINLNYPNNMEPIGTILVDTKKIDNSELKITTILTEKDEMIDCKSDTSVYEDKGNVKLRRSMNCNELKQFKSNWRKIWHPQYSEESVNKTIYNPTIKAYNPQQIYKKDIPNIQMASKIENNEIEMPPQLVPSKQSMKVSTKRQEIDLEPSGQERSVDPRLSIRATQSMANKSHEN